MTDIWFFSQRSKVDTKGVLFFKSRAQKDSKRIVCAKYVRDFVNNQDLQICTYIYQISINILSGWWIEPI